MSGNMRNELIKIIYEKLSSEIRTLERNYLTLIAAMISSLGIFYYGLKDFFKQIQLGHKIEGVILFTISSITSILISCIIVFISNIFGYLHRCNQLILSKIEEKYYLYDIKILPQKWNLYKKLIRENQSIDLPETYKLFKRIGLLLIEVELVYYFFMIFLIYKYQIIDQSIQQFKKQLNDISLEIIIILVFILIFSVLHWLIVLFCLTYIKDKKTIKKIVDLILDKSLFVNFTWIKYKNDIKELPKKFHN